MREFAYVCVALVAMLFLAGAVYGMWSCERAVHYNLSYKSMVQQTIRQMVRPEALRETRDSSDRK